MTSRKAFEAAYMEEQLRRCGEGFRSTVEHSLSQRKPDGDYLHYLESIAWKMWKAAAPDAEAYRFLRDQAVSARASCGDVPVVRCGLGEVLHGEALDQAVARALEKHG